MAAGRLGAVAAGRQWLGVVTASRVALPPVRQAGGAVAGTPATEVQTHLQGK